MSEAKKNTRGVFEKIKGSGIWWINYFDGVGRRHREKVGSKARASQLYQIRKVEAAEGRKFPENMRAMVRVEDLVPALFRDYERDKKKSLDSARRRWEKHLRPFFARLPVDSVGTKEVDDYIDRRIGEGAGNATINREMAVLKRMYSLGRRSRPPQVREIPPLPRLKEPPPRTGFVEDGDYDLLQRHAREPWLRAILATAYTFGCRRGEMLELRVGQVDLFHRTIRLLAGTTKTDETRTVKMTGEVHALLTKCVRNKRADDYVFTRGTNPVLNFRGAWYALCERAGLGEFVKGEDKKLHWEGPIFHDLRRSAVRNMVRRGVSETVAMKISGHKTRSVFDRYNIVSESDIADAAQKIERGRLKSEATKKARRA